MSKLPSFSEIESFSEIIEHNELFSQAFSDELSAQYDSNFIQLHFNPSIKEFILLEQMQMDFRYAVNQDFLKFRWPENTGLYIDVMEYLNQKNYELGKLELFYIAPEYFIYDRLNSEIQMDEVSEKSLEEFLALNYNEDIHFGEHLAKHRQHVYRHQFSHPHTTFILAYLEKEAVGSLLFIESEQYIEVDNVLTDRSYRKMDVATTLLHYVIERAKYLNKEIILVADAEDSPREMYEKLGFHSVATQIHALKKL